MVISNSDWLVADSEDEDVFAKLPPVNASRASPANLSTSLETSVIQTAAFTPDQLRTPQQGPQSPSASADGSFIPPARVDSTITDFTSVPSTFGAPSKVIPKPRPRPRVVMKNADPNADGASTPFSRISDPPVSTRRTDSIHPATTMSFGLSDAIDDMYSSFGIAERAKMRSRRKPYTAKQSIPPPDQIEVIELTSDEDEFSLKPAKRQKKQGNTKPKAPTKSRPKPTLKVKRVAVAVIPNDSPSSGDVVQRSQVPPAQYASSSQPPASTLPTIPPSTPPPARELTPLSSPLVTTRKRKRIRPSVAEDDDYDEMDIISSNPTGVSPSLAMPPPFFAPSSSSLPTDSGVDIPPIESLGALDKKKQPSSKKSVQTKTKNKGKRGKKVEVTSAVTEVAEEPAGTNQEPSSPAGSHDASECHSPVARNSLVTKKVSGNRSVTKSGTAKAVNSYEDDSDPSLNAPIDEGEDQRSKENRPGGLGPPKQGPPERTLATSVQARGSSIRPKSTPMTELIRRVNSQPCSPFPNASRTYSPFLKSSRTMLSRIAPLHPNRRTPPPPLPRPPPPKKSKRQLEIEERIDEELAETVDGWSCLTDEERKALRKARIDAELGYE